MAGRVKGGLLGRWFEELCRIDYMTLEEVTASNRSCLKPSVLPTEGGVYAFWWTGPAELLESRNQNLALHGPGGREVTLKIDDEWLGLSADLPIPLYIGKTASNLSNRVGQHLMLGNEGCILKNTGGAKKLKAPTTSCQLRAGIEHLFPGDANIPP